MIAILLMLIIQMIGFYHYFFISNHNFFLSGLQSTLIAAVFLVVSYLFCKNSSRLLPQKHTWLRFLKILGVASFLFQLYVIISTQNRLSNGSINQYTLCKNLTFVLLQAGQALVSFIFLAAGIVISRKLNVYIPMTKFELFVHDRNKSRALKQLWLCIITYLTKLVYGILYSMFLFLLYDSEYGCTAVTDSHTFNNTLWFFSRSMENYLWIYPFIYVFWP